MSNLDVNSSIYSKGTLREVSTRRFEDGREKLTLEPISLTERRLAEIGLGSQVAKVQSAVVRLQLQVLDSEKTRPAGSGYLISPDGLGITNWHVASCFGLLDNRKFHADFTVLPGQNLPELSEDKIIGKNVEDYSGSPKIACYPVPIKVLATSKKEDLAIFVVDLPETQDPWPYIPIIDETPKKGEAVFALGHKGGTRYSLLSPGRVIEEYYSFGARNARELERVKQVIQNLPVTQFTPPVLGSIKTSCRTGPGASGGVLCNEDGKAVGTINGGAGRLRVLFLNLLRMFKGNIWNEEEFPPAGYEVIRGTKQSGIPFLRGWGINIDDALQGKPLRASNVLKKKIEKD